MASLNQFMFVIIIQILINCCNAKNVNSTKSVALKNCTLEGLKSIRDINANPIEITINNCVVQNLPNAVFIRFSALKSLEISESHLEHIQDFAFNGLINLEILILKSNNLTTIKPWSDEYLDVLHTLDLRRNLIRDIHKSALLKYPGLLKLNLAVNSIKEIPEEIFRFTPALKSLNLARNLLEYLDESSFKHLHKLSHLELRHNKIKNIDYLTFKGNTHLRSLHLQDNKVIVFPKDVTTNLPRLVHLNLSHNEIQQLTDGTFTNNLELKVLDVSFNKLKEFGNESFRGLETLEVRFS